MLQQNALEAQQQRAVNLATNRGETISSNITIKNNSFWIFKIFYAKAYTLKKGVHTDIQILQFI